MKRYWRVLCAISICIIFVVVMAWCIKNLNLSWVEASSDEVKITINFLLPMEQNQLKKHLQIVGAKKDQNHFLCSIYWINKSTVVLTLQEKNVLKGQKVHLLVHNAPTQINGITKSETLPIQFKSDIELLSQKKPLLVASSRKFAVAFNTPISIREFNQFLDCEADFYVTHYTEVLPNGEKLVDQTQFILTPQKALTNGKHYILTIKKGMRSISGAFLKTDQMIALQVDEKPNIKKVYPANGDKWIGLYPRLLLDSEKPIVKATAELNGHIIEGTLSDDRHAYFILDELLSPNTTYTLNFQTQVQSGEASEIKQVHFSTTSIDPGRFWLDIRKSQSVIICYDGTQKVKTIPCQLPNEISHLLSGTYYLYGKSEVYEDNVNRLGGNYWLIISEKIGIQGTVRNAYWQPVQGATPQKNIVVSDKEADWLYQKLENDTMIILRN